MLDSRTIWVDGRHRVFLPVLDMANNKDHPTRAHRTVRDPQTGYSNTPAIWAVKKVGNNNTVYSRCARVALARARVRVRA